MYNRSQAKALSCIPSRRNYLLILLCLTGSLALASRPKLVAIENDTSSTVSIAKNDTSGIAPRKTFLLNNSLRFNIGIGNSSSEEKEKKYVQMRFSGFMRSWFFYRNLKDVYDFPEQGGITLPVNISLGDGYDQPLLQVLMEANPFPATRLAVEFAFNNALLRGGSFNNLSNSQGRMASAWQTLQFQAETYTSIGSFKLVAGGGVNWYRMSPFTLWSANDFNIREDMFERLPWEPPGDDFARYNAYYSSGVVPRDQRWGNASTQGIILEGKGLPLGLNASVLVGKGAGSSGFQSYTTKTPLNLFAFRVEKVLGKQRIGYNYIDQFGNNDNHIPFKQIIGANGKDTFYVEENRLSQLATTLDGTFRFGKVIIFTEVGLGSYLSPLYNKGLRPDAKPGLENVSRYKRDWDELLFLELGIADFPLKAAAYRVGKYYLNFSSAVANASVDQSVLNVGQSATNTASFDGLIPMIGQMVNNRQGINLLFTKKFGGLVAKAAYGISQELENMAGDSRNGSRGTSEDSTSIDPYTNSITFQHLLNNLTRSRFGFWQRFSGPYNRLHNSFRRSFENIAITDTVVDYKKSFFSIDFELKYKFILFNRPLILSNYINYNTVQEQVSPLPAFGEDAFIKVLYEEFLVFYNLHRKITAVGLLGFQTVKGNKRTELADENGDLITQNGRVIYDPKGSPVNQTGYAYGLGFDYDFHNRASLHLRQRWYTHKDKNFTRDRFRGHEATVELKVFF